MSPPPPVPPEFRAAIDDALELLKDRPAPLAPVATGQPLPSLLEQCRDTLARGRAQQPPVRLLHHMACTGGTLISLSGAGYSDPGLELRFGDQIIVEFEPMHLTLNPAVAFRRKRIGIV